MLPPLHQYVLWESSVRSIRSALRKLQYCRLWKKRKKNMKRLCFRKMSSLMMLRKRKGRMKKTKKLMILYLSFKQKNNKD